MSFYPIYSDLFYINLQTLISQPLFKGILKFETLLSPRQTCKRAQDMLPCKDKNPWENYLRKKIVDLLWPLVYAEIIGRCLVTKCSKGSTPGLAKEPLKISAA